MGAWRPQGLRSGRRRLGLHRPGTSGAYDAYVAQRRQLVHRRRRRSHRCALSEHGYGWCWCCCRPACWIERGAGDLRLKVPIEGQIEYRAQMGRLRYEVRREQRCSCGGSWSLILWCSRSGNSIGDPRCMEPMSRSLVQLAELRSLHMA